MTEWKSILALLPDHDAVTLAHRLIRAASVPSCPNRIWLKVAADSLAFLPERDREDISHAALSVLRQHSDETFVLTTLGAMLALLPEKERIPRRSEIARRADELAAELPIKSDPEYLHIGLSLLPYMSADLAGEVAEALVSAHGRGQITTLCKLATSLQGGRKAEVIREIAALALKYGTTLSGRTLEEVRRWLPPGEFEQLWRVLYSQALDITDSREQVTAFARLIGVSPADFVPDIAAAVLAAAAVATAWEEEWCADLGAVVASADPDWLETSMLPTVVSFTGRLEPVSFARLLVELSGRVDPRHHPFLLAEATKVAPFESWTVACQIAAARLMNDEAAMTVLANVLDQHANIDRAELLADIDLLMPLVAHLGGSDAVSACWTSLWEAANALP